ncbi:MAG: histidine phosphatase family protein [Solimonas sp.]
MRREHVGQHRLASYDELQTGILWLLTRKGASMKRVIFVRHGESVSNAGGITMENAAIPLSERGRRQAVAIAECLPASPSLVLVSPMIRTHQTAEPYCGKLGMQPVPDASLAEFSMVCPSLIAGLSGEQRKPFVEAYWADPDPERRLGPDADTFLEFHGRVREFAGAMSKLPDVTVVFGHGIWFGLLLWHLLGYNAGDAQDMRSFRRFQQGLPMPNCALFHITGNGSHWSVRTEVSAAQRIAAVG